VIGPHIGIAKTLLEIGPGGGFALNYFRQKGLTVKGVETSESSSAFMRQRLGIPVENAMLEKYVDANTYDLVILNHVLEHFLDIHTAMEKLKSLVTPGGLLYIRVPNHDSYDRRQMGEKWPAYLPFHISYFSEKSLRMLYAQYGFEVILTSSYVSENFMKGYPAILRKIGRKVIQLSGMENRFSGRSITILGRRTS
jgi:2-polyprenyl-3-methyl-5-hydroxy-6-metoxy-1,4-benzoquinol methylase